MNGRAWAVFGNKRDDATNIKRTLKVGCIFEISSRKENVRKNADGCAEDCQGLLRRCRVVEKEI